MHVKEYLKEYDTGKLIEISAPTAKEEIEKCRNTCPGPDKCRKNGYIFAENTFFKCDIYEQFRRISRIQSIISRNVPISLYNAKLETFSPVNESQQEAKNVAERFLEKQAYLDGKGFFLFGPNGVGKTHIAASVYRELLARNIPAVFARPKTCGGYPAIESYYQTLQEPQVLIYDDLGTELRKDFIIDILFQLIDKRYNDGKSIVATTNLTLQQLADWFGPRIMSRLQGKNFMLPVEGEDYRFTHKERFQEVIQMMKQSEKDFYLEILKDMKKELNDEKIKFDTGKLKHALEFWNFTYRITESTTHGCVEVWVYRDNPHFCHLGQIEVDGEAVPVENNL